MLRRALVPFLLVLACDGEATQTAPAKAAPAKAEPAKAEPAKPEPTKAEPAKPAPDAKEACAKLLVVAWQGAEGADPAVTRDEAAAKARAAELHAKLTSGTALAELAGESDEPKTRAKGGAMGTFEREKWPEKYAAIADAVFALHVGETAAPVRTPLGYVVAQRCAVDKVHARHILVRYKGAKNAEASVKRDKRAAQRLAEEALAEVTGGKDFAEVARKRSEDGSAERGGDLGSVGRGMFAPPFEAAAWALKPGETSAVVETDFGFHVIQRVE
jgi:parvulin-like peptidyl-prolyl isomerase